MCCLWIFISDGLSGDWQESFIYSEIRRRWRTLPRQGTRAFLELATRHALHSNNGSRFELELDRRNAPRGNTGSMVPPLFMMHKLVSTLINIKPSLFQIKGQGLSLSLSLPFTPSWGRINTSPYKPHR